VLSSEFLERIFGLQSPGGTIIVCTIITESGKCTHKVIADIRQEQCSIIKELLKLFRTNIGICCKMFPVALARTIQRNNEVKDSIGLWRHLPENNPGSSPCSPSIRNKGLEI
jgi:hypothetical protein